MNDAQFQQVREWCEPYLGLPQSAWPKVVIDWRTRDQVSWDPDSLELHLSPNEYLSLKNRLEYLNRVR